jgi:hypothetical protein
VAERWFFRVGKSLYYDKFSVFLPLFLVPRWIAFTPSVTYLLVPQVRIPMEFISEQVVADTIVLDGRIIAGAALYLTVDMSGLG